jgi:hypothetical protein
VNPGKVPEVSEVLHLPRGVALPPVRSSAHGGPGVVLQFRNLWKRPARLPEGCPHDPVPFQRAVSRYPCLGRHPRRVSELRDRDAAAVGCVPPAVVRADDLAAPDPAKGERSAPVNAQVRHGADAARAAPQDQWLAEQVGLDRAIGQVRSEGHRMPAVSERPQVGEHPRACRCGGRGIGSGAHS